MLLDVLVIRTAGALMTASEICEFDRIPFLSTAQALLQRNNPPSHLIKDVDGASEQSEDDKQDDRHQDLRCIDVTIEKVDTVAMNGVK
jgi:hypothetical protein